MSPEYGATCGFFPVDELTLTYLRLTGRARGARRAGRGVLQGEPALARPERSSPSTRRSSSSTSARSSRASPGRAARRTACRSADAKDAFLDSLSSFGAATATARSTRRVADSFPASDPDVVQEAGPRTIEPDLAQVADRRAARSLHTATVELRRRGVRAEHGSVVIAAITSCTNTSNPQVMLGAGLLAKKAVERGLAAQAVGEVLARARLAGRDRVLRQGRPDAVPRASSASTPSATAARPASGTPARCRSRSRRRSTEGDLVVCSVLSGNRNFEARIHPEVKANYLASPPLVVAYALAGRMDIDLDERAARPGPRRRGRLPARPLADARGDRARRSPRRSTASMFARTYADVFTGDERWRALPVPEGDLYDWEPTTRPTSAGRRTSRACRASPSRSTDVDGARCLVIARRLGHDRPHLARRLDQAREPGRRVPDRARRRARATSTRTARGAATTR